MIGYVSEIYSLYLRMRPKDPYHMSVKCSNLFFTDKTTSKSYTKTANTWITASQNERSCLSDSPIERRSRDSLPANNASRGPPRVIALLAQASGPRVCAVRVQEDG